MNDPERYKKLYFDERDDLRTSNAGQEYGKVVADLLEKGERSDDVLTDTAMFLLEKYDVADKEIRTVLHTDDGDIPLVLRPDSLNSETKDFLEYKTGKNAWTPEKAQNHIQMHFYQAGIFCEYNVALKKAKLIWIETHVNDKAIIEPTGRIESFDVHFTTKSRLETMALIAKVAKEIEIAYAQHTPDPRIAQF